MCSKDDIINNIRRINDCSLNLHERGIISSTDLSNIYNYGLKILECIITPKKDLRCYKCHRIIKEGEGYYQIGNKVCCKRCK